MIDMGSGGYEKRFAEKVGWLQRTAGQWEEFVLEHKILSQDYVVLLASRDEEINYYTLRFLTALRKQEAVRRFYILSPSPAMEEFVRKHTSVPYRFICCGQELADSLARLYGIRTFTPQLIVNSFKLSADTDAFRLVDGHITKADVVALVVLQLDEVPDLREASAQGEGVPVLGSGEWEDMGYEAPCAPYGERDLEKNVAYALKPLLEDGRITRQDEIVLFGVTQTARCAAGQLRGYRVSAYWDNSESLAGTAVDGIPVERPRERLGGVKILVASRRYREICGQLRGLGYEVGEQVFVIYSVHLNIGLSKEAVRELVEDYILEGKRVYEEIRARYPKETIFVRPWQGTGDIYLLGAYMDEMLGNNHTDKYVLTVTTASIKKTIELFGVNAILCGQKDAFKMLRFGRLMGLGELGMVSLNDNLDQRNLVRIRGYKGLDSHTLFQKLVFRCGSRATEFHFYQESADGIFERHGLPKGRTVLLSPYAVTIDDLPMERWERLADKLMQKGLAVCTNVGSDREAPVKGTQGIFIPYRQIVDFTGKAGGFVGLRNGLCDIISSSHARLAAIYPKNKPRKDSFYYRCYSLRKMGLRDEDLLELEYDGELTDRQIDEIAEFMEL